MITWIDVIKRRAAWPKFANMHRANSLAFAKTLPDGLTDAQVRRRIGVYRRSIRIEANKLYGRHEGIERKSKSKKGSGYATYLHHQQDRADAHEHRNCILDWLNSGDIHMGCRMDGWKPQVADWDLADALAA